MYLGDMKPMSAFKLLVFLAGLSTALFILRMHRVPWIVSRAPLQSHSQWVIIANQTINDAHTQQVVSQIPNRAPLIVSHTASPSQTLTSTVFESAAILETQASESQVTPARAAEKKLEFVHITKTGGSAIEKAASKAGLIWGACHYLSNKEVGCSQPDLPWKEPGYQSFSLTSPWHTPPKWLKHSIDEGMYPYNGADLFVVIRNPYSRIVSEYYCPWNGFQGKHRNNPDVMNEWVKHTVTALDTAMDEFNDRNRDGQWRRVQAKVEERTKRSKYGHFDPYRYLFAQKHYINQAEYVYDGDSVIVKNVVHYENLSKEFDALMKKYGIDLSLPPKEKDGTYTYKSQSKLSHTDLNPDTIALINKFAKPDFERFGYQRVENFGKDDRYSLEATTMR